MSDHAPLAPSAAHRWVRCPGSVRMTKDLPAKPAGRAAARGTAMHQVLENCIKKGKHPSVFLDHVFDIDGEEVQFDDEMVGWTTEALEWVQKYKAENKGSHIISEARLHSGAALSEDLIEDIWGTADVLIYNKDELVVFDYKGGYVDVEIEDNYQLIIYGIGGIHFIEDAMDVPAIEKVRLVIHQPRSGGAKQLVVMRETLEEWGEYIEKAAKEAKQPGAPLRASDEACKWCPVIGRCPAAHERATELARNTEWPEVATTITDESLVKLLVRADFIRKFLSAAEAYATQRLVNGYSIPGFKLVHGNKHRKWKDEQEAQYALQKFMEEDDFMVTKIRTPAQVEKLLKNDKDKIQDLIEKPLGDPELAPQDDPRPTIPFKELKVIEGGKNQLDKKSEAVVESPSKSKSTKRK